MPQQKTHLHLAGNISPTALNDLITHLAETGIQPGGCSGSLEGTANEYTLYQGGTSLEDDVCEAIKAAGLSYVAFIYPEGSPNMTWLDGHCARENFSFSECSFENKLLITIEEAAGGEYDAISDIQDTVDDILMRELVIQ